MNHQFAIIGPELDIMCLKGKGEKQKERKLMFLNTYSMPELGLSSHLIIPAA